MKVVSINISNIKSVEELHQLLKSKLNFHAFYGMNWDAFWDSITGLVQMPDKLEIIGLEKFSKKFPKDAKKFVACLNDYNNQEDLKKLKLVMHT